MRVGIKQIISRAVTKRIRKGKLTQILKVGDGGNKHCIAGVSTYFLQFEDEKKKRAECILAMMSGNP